MKLLEFNSGEYLLAVDSRVVLYDFRNLLEVDSRVSPKTRFTRESTSREFLTSMDLLGSLQQPGISKNPK